MKGERMKLHLPCHLLLWNGGWRDISHFPFNILAGLMGSFKVGSGQDFQLFFVSFLCSWHCMTAPWPMWQTLTDKIKPVMYWLYDSFLADFMILSRYHWSSELKTFFFFGKTKLKTWNFIISTMVKWNLSYFTCIWGFKAPIYHLQWLGNLLFFDTWYL